MNDMGQRFGHKDEIQAKAVHFASMIKGKKVTSKDFIG